MNAADNRSQQRCGHRHEIVRLRPGQTAQQAIKNPGELATAAENVPDWNGQPKRSRDNNLASGCHDLDLGTEQRTLESLPAQPGDEKWNEVEGNYVLATLDLVRKRIAQQMDAELADVGSALPEWAVDDTARESELTRRVTEAVFVVSPFREIVDNLRNKVGDRLLSAAKRLGTIHTTQGKEADIVILVLGTAKEQSGSRNWAAKTPNLLNVAVTRARRRLFVIGDYGSWSRHRNFRTLAQYGSDGPDSLLTVVKADEVALRPM